MASHAEKMTPVELPAPADVKPAAGAAAAAGPAKGKARKGPSIDRSDGFFRTFNICALFGVAFYYAYQNAPNANGGAMMYNRSAFYDAMVSEPVYMGIPALYLVAVWTLSRYMRDKAPATEFLRNRVQPVYNLTQIVLCAYMSWGLCPTDIRNPFGLNNKRNADVEWFVFVHFLSKYLDYVDTFVMVFKKSYRQISFLQVFHHATIAMVWPFLLSRGWGSGTASYGAFINSVTHVIMYTHYFVSSFGINNPFKRWITTFQLSQFASCIVHALLVLSYETVYPIELSYLQVAYHIIMLYLFGFQMLWAPQWCTGPVPAAEKPKHA